MNASPLPQDRRSAHVPMLAPPLWPSALDAEYHAALKALPIPEPIDQGESE